MQLYLQNCQKHPELDKGNDFSINSLLLEVTAPYITMHKSARHLENQRATQQKKNDFVTTISTFALTSQSFGLNKGNCNIQCVNTIDFFFFPNGNTIDNSQLVHLHPEPRIYTSWANCHSHNLKILCYSQGFFP